MAPAAGGARRRLADVELDLARGEVEVLALPEARGLLLVDHGGDHSGLATAFVDLGERLLVLEVDLDASRPRTWERIEAGPPPRLLGRELALVRAPCSRVPLPVRCSGEPVVAPPVLPAVCAAPAWYPSDGELLAGRLDDVPALLAGPAPAARAFAWADRGTPET